MSLEKNYLERGLWASEYLELVKSKKNADSMREMRKLLSILGATSSYVRQPFSEEQEILHSSEDELFQIKRIINSEDPALLQMHDLFWKEFGYEMDFFPSVKEWVKDENISYNVILNTEHKVVAAANSSYLPFGSEKESMLVIGFMAVDGQYRGKRLANELYRDIYCFALNRISTEGTILKAIVGEASHKEIKTIEHVLNREEIGRKRIYYENKEGDIKEIPYFSPPLYWNHNSGMPREDVQPNHLMARFLDGKQSISSRLLMEMVKKLYDDFYMPGEHYFSNKEAFTKARNAFDSYLVKIEAPLTLAKNGKVFLLSAQERAEKTGRA